MPENPSWGYTRLQGALKNLGHRVARSTIATILKQDGIPPRDERPTPWRAFLTAHWGAFVAADFFTTEIWTIRDLVTYYTLFVIELHSRRVRIIGSTPYPDEAFMRQIGRELTDATDGVLQGPRFLICDRDRKWSTGIPSLLETSGVRVIRTPFRAPNHRERNHQGLGNELIDDERGQQCSGRVRRRPRIGGLLNYYYRAAQPNERENSVGGVVGHYAFAAAGSLLPSSM